MSTSELYRVATDVLETARTMNVSGINRGSSGNISQRYGEGFIITPTGMAYDHATPGDMVYVKLDGEVIAQGNQRKPSSEWRFHRDIYQQRSEAQAIIHTHSPFATSLACQGLSIPAFHYMIASFGGSDVRCADYATFGTQALSDTMLVALQDRQACLMAHHGMLVFSAKSLRNALDLAIELENLSEQYWRVLQLGSPQLIDEAEMARVLEKFKGYGQQ
jgi:L-fuculose-phosphate aldolase